MERACRTIEDLALGAADLLVDVDLHYRNVLAGRREPWLAIDPKVVAGDPEYAAAALLWQPFTGIRARSDLDRKLAILTDAAGFDEQKARAWTFVRVVDYWLWAVEQGLTENLACCEALAGYLSGSAGE
jgi:streptomycin 6-kinase